AQRRRTQPSGRNQRTDERSVYRGDFAVRVPTEWDADVEHSDPGAGFDGAAAKECVRARSQSFTGFNVSKLCQMGIEFRSYLETLKPYHLATLSLIRATSQLSAGTDPWSRLF